MILCRALSYEENTLDKSRLKRKCWRTMRKPTVLRIASTSQMMVGLVEVLTAQVGSA